MTGPLTTASTTTTTTTLIVGAGLAGLMAAQVLARRGERPLLVETEDRVGGRLATRSLSTGQGDLGAQFFTVREEAFRRWVDGWRAAGLAFEWGRGWSDGSLGVTSPDGHPRYAIRGGMAALATYLAEGLNVRLGVRVAGLAASDEGWRAIDAMGYVYYADRVVLTPPVPLARALLEAGGVRLQRGDRAALDAITYAPTLAALFRVRGAVMLPEPGAVQRPGALIRWIADNRRKGISPDATVITVHAGESLSRRLWGASDDDALDALAEGLDPFLANDAWIVESHLARWSYARPVQTHGERCLRLKGLPPLALASDAFGGPRMEGAALSGLAAADALES